MPVLLFGLVLVPLVCAGAVAMLYGMAFPSAEKAKKRVIDQALASCRYAFVAERENNDRQAPMLLHAPSHASMEGETFYFAWHDKPPGAVPRQKPAITCLGTLSVGIVSNLHIDGKKVGR